MSLRAPLILAAALSLASRAVPIRVIEGPTGVSQVLDELGRDGHPVVLHFFATWCSSCRAEMPLLRRAFAAAEGHGAHVALISLDAEGDQTRKLPRFLEKNRLTSPAFLLNAPDPDPITRLIDPNWTGDLPATFVFQNGKRVASFLGPLPSSAALQAKLGVLPQAPDTR